MDPSEQRTEQWYHQYGESIYRRCLRILGDEASAWDVTQEVFIRAHRSAHKFRGDCSVLTWLLTIADRRCFAVLRKRRAHRDKIERYAALGTVKQTGESIEQVLARSDLVGQLLPRFGEDVQRIVALRFFDELGHQEIAEQLGVSRKTIHRKLDRFFAYSRKILTRLNEVTESRSE